MGYLLDLAIVLIFAICIFVGIRKGFIKTVVSLIGSFGAMIIAGLLSRPIAGGIFDLFFKNSLTESVQGALMKASGAGLASEKAAVLLDELPTFLSAYLKAGDLEGQLESAVSGAVGTAANAVVGLLSPLFISFIQIITFFILFLAATLVIKLFSHALEGLFKAPVLGGINKALGGVSGALRAFILCLLIGVVLFIFVPFPENDSGIFSGDTIRQSSLFSYFYLRNPIISLFSGL